MISASNLLIDLMEFVAQTFSATGAIGISKKSLRLKS